MIRTLALAVMLMSLSGCVAVLPAALFIVNAISTAATVAETTCQVGEVLTTANPTALDGHPNLQAAERACEALAP